MIQTCFGQVRNIRIDSLVNYVNEHFSRGANKDYLMGEFAVYESPDKSEAVHIFLDSLNKPSEHIGLCVVYYMYDSLNRLQTIEGWNSKGEPSYWDFSPLTTFHYEDYSNSTLIKKLQEIIPDLNSPSNTFTMIVENEVFSNSLSKYNKTFYKLSSEDMRWSLKYYSRPEKGIQTASENVLFVLKKRDTAYVLESEYYIGVDTTLVDGSHSRDTYNSSLGFYFDGDEYNFKYSVAKKFEGKISGGINYFDKNNNLVFTSYTWKRGITEGTIEDDE